MFVLVFLILLVLLFGAPFVLLGGAGAAAGIAYLLSDMMHNSIVFWGIGIGLLFGLLKALAASAQKRAAQAASEAKLARAVAAGIAAQSSSQPIA